MNTTQGRTRLIVWVVIIIVVVGAIALIWVHTSGSPAGSTAATNGTSTADAGNGAMTTTVTSAPATGGGATTVGAGSSNSGSKSGTTVPVNNTPAITINLLTPISGNTWTIGQSNSIAWSKAAGVTGEIDLVNAQTHAVIGVILSETGPNQTSYAWDGRSIYAARYSAEKHDVVAGTYAIRIHFDGNGLGALVSGPVTIQH